MVDWIAKGWRVFDDDAPLNGHGSPVGIIEHDIVLGGPVHLRLYYGDGGMAHGWLQIPDVSAQEFLENFD